MRTIDTEKKPLVRSLIRTRTGNPPTRSGTPSPDGASRPGTARARGRPGSVHRRVVAADPAVTKGRPRPPLACPARGRQREPAHIAVFAAPHVAVGEQPGRPGLRQQFPAAALGLAMSGRRPLAWVP